MASTTMAVGTQIASLAVASPSLFRENGSSRVAATSQMRPQRLLVQMSVRNDSDSEVKTDGNLSVGRRQAMVSLSAAAAAVVVAFRPQAEDEAFAADLTQRLQRGEFQGKIKDALKVGIQADPSIAPLLLRLAINDIASYDPVTKTGGANGSIRFSEELSKPANKGLDKALKFLEGVKESVDSSKSGPVSWADIIQFGGQAAAKRLFLEHAIKFAGGDEEKGKTIYQAFGSAGQWGFFDKQFGRADATEADKNSGFNWASASAGEIKEKFASLSVKPRYVCTLTAFLAEDQDAMEEKLSADADLAPNVKKYQRSRREVSETEYEVDLISTFTKLSTLGQKINYEAYTYAPPRPTFKL